MKNNPGSTELPPAEDPSSRPALEAGARPLLPSHARGRGTVAPQLEIGRIVNPVIFKDFPDPGVFKVGSTFYAYSTCSDGTNIQVARSQDLLRWEFLPDALPTLPKWAAQEFGWTWSPVVTETPEGFLMYFTARYRSNGQVMQAIGVGMSDRPEGPFDSLDDYKPFICQGNLGGAIDPSAFMDSDGIRYLLWKNDGNARNARTWIYIQKVAIDGLTLLGAPVRLITADLPWEGVLVEAPTLWKHQGKYFLFYSANHFTSSGYAIGYAVSDCIWGPYVKSNSPFLTTDPIHGIVGPGGQDIVTGPDGYTWMLYHAWSLDGSRSLRVEPLKWSSGI